MLNPCGIEALREINGVMPGHGGLNDVLRFSLLNTAIAVHFAAVVNIRGLTFDMTARNQNAKCNA